MKYIIAAFVLGVMLALAVAQAEGQAFIVQPEVVQSQRDRLNALDYAMWGTASALVLVDWQQTIAFRKEGRKESNPVLGPEPSLNKVRALIGLSLVAHAAIAKIDSRAVRYMLWGATIVGEVHAVSSNFRKGWGITLKF